MTAKEFAAMIAGREVGGELTPSDERQAEQSGLVVVFGHSDDCAELYGAICDEVYINNYYSSADIYLTKNGTLHTPDCGNDDCPYFSAAKENAKLIRAVWHDEGDPYWTFETDIPCETFEIYEDGEVFCVGIVFSVNDL